MINGVCQNCGAVAPLEWFLTDAKHKECLKVAAKLPAELADQIMGYLSLFRPASGRVVTAGKALRLLTELAGLVASGHVQVQGKPARTCPPRIWAAAMSQMVERRERISRPLPNHNYLRQVAWQLADEADAQGERCRNEQERSGNLRSYEAAAPAARPRGINPLAKLMGYDEESQ